MTKEKETTYINYPLMLNSYYRTLTKTSLEYVLLSCVIIVE